MHLIRLQIHHVRNLHKVILEPHPKFNIFLGKNGSGKTSLLEAIHFLSVGRSFRAHQIQPVIGYEATALACFAEVLDKNNHKIPIGIEKNRQGEVKCKVAGESCERLSTFAATLPTQLITPETFRLLLAGPEERRRFLDWGVFHVEPHFAELCYRYQRLLKQRNAVLKQGVANQLPGWEKELVLVGEQISHYRQKYIVELLPFVQEARECLLPAMALDFDFQRGWSPEISLEEALIGALALDMRRGYTSVGPHRAEITIRVKNFPAQQILSRGQQKLLISALHVAQAQQLRAKSGKKCLYLIDDLASELDQENRYRLLSLLAEQHHQVFLTGVDPQGWTDIVKTFSGEMFHVEHGQVAPISTPPVG